MIPITFELKLIRSVNACRKHHWPMGTCTLLYSSQSGVEVTFQNSHSNLRNLYHFSVYFFDFVYCACMPICACICVCVNVCMHSCQCVHVFMCMHLCVYMCVHVDVFVCICCVHSSLCVHACVCVDTQSLVAQVVLDLLILYPTRQTLGLQACVRMPRFPYFLFFFF